MKSQNDDSKNITSHTSFGEIRDEIDNINSLMIYFKNAFSHNVFDAGIELKRDFLEKKLLEEFKSKENNTNELISHLATAMAVAEKESLNFFRFKTFITVLEKRMHDLAEATSNKAKGGRKNNDLMFDIAFINVQNFRQVHNGKYPSAKQLSDTVSKEAVILFESLNKGEHESIPQEFKNCCLIELQKRDKKLEQNGINYLPTATARSYISRIKRELNE